MHIPKYKSQHDNQLTFATKMIPQDWNNFYNSISLFLFRHSLRFTDHRDANGNINRICVIFHRISSAVIPRPQGATAGWPVPVSSFFLFRPTPHLWWVCLYSAFSLYQIDYPVLFLAKFSLNWQDCTGDRRPARRWRHFFFPIFGRMVNTSFNKTFILVARDFIRILNRHSTLKRPQCNLIICM